MLHDLNQIFSSLECDVVFLVEGMAALVFDIAQIRRIWKHGLVHRLVFFCILPHPPDQRHFILRRGWPLEHIYEGCISGKRISDPRQDMNCHEAMFNSTAPGCRTLRKHERGGALSAASISYGSWARELCILLQGQATRGLHDSCSHSIAASSHTWLDTIGCLTLLRPDPSITPDGKHHISRWNPDARPTSRTPIATTYSAMTFTSASTTRAMR
jgi:hypothetical protein